MGDVGRHRNRASVKMVGAWTPRSAAGGWVWTVCQPSTPGCAMPWPRLTFSGAVPSPIPDRPTPPRSPLGSLPGLPGSGGIRPSISGRVHLVDSTDASVHFPCWAWLGSEQTNSSQCPPPRTPAVAPHLSGAPQGKTLSLTPRSPRSVPLLLQPASAPPHWPPARQGKGSAPPPTPCPPSPPNPRPGSCQRTQKPLL